MTLLALPYVVGMDFPVSTARTPALLAVRFGDSYRMECQDGISGEKQTDITVSWSKLSKVDKNVIDGFFKERGGYQRFSFTMPHASTGYVYICPTWKCTEQAYNNWSISATWKRVPDTSV